MAATKKRATRRPRKADPAKPVAEAAPRGPSLRLRRSDDEKLRIVQQVLASANQSAEIKALGIYPNQFYDWKKKYAGGGHRAGLPSPRRKAGRSASFGGQSATEEAKAFLNGKGGLLQRLRAQRAELDALIAQLEQ